MRLEARLDNNDLRQRAKGKLRKANETLSKDSINPASCHRDVRIEFRIGGKEREREREKGKVKERKGAENVVWKENYPFSSFVPSSRRGIGEPSSHYERKRLVIPQPDAGKRRLKRRQANHSLDFPTRDRRSDSKIFLSEREREREREGVARTTESFAESALFEARKGSTVKRCSHSKVFVNIGSQRLPSSFST